MSGGCRQAVVAALLLGSIGCVWKVPRVGEAGPVLPDADKEAAYQALLQHFTAHVELYAGFDTQMLSAMTYQSPSFRRARVERMAAFQSLPKEVVDRRLAEEAAEADAFHDFFFGAHVNEHRYDDFDRKDSVWRIALVTDAGEVVPASVERVGRSDLALRAIYPYLDEFWVGYRFRFPKKTPNGTPLITDGTPMMTVRVASILGRADFKIPPH